MRKKLALLYLHEVAGGLIVPDALIVHMTYLGYARVRSLPQDLEVKRGVAIRTRNLRLTAIRSFFRFVSFEEPAHSTVIRRVLAIPSKRHGKRQVHFLTRPEIDAILAAADRAT